MSALNFRKRGFLIIEEKVGKLCIFGKRVQRVLLYMIKKEELGKAKSLLNLIVGNVIEAELRKKANDFVKHPFTEGDELAELSLAVLDTYSRWEPARIKKK